MSPITVNAGASWILRVSFFDENDTPVIPNSIKWSLVDSEGNIINGRDEVAVSPAAAVVYIHLLPLDNAETLDSKRVVRIKAKYFSVLIPGEEITLIEEAVYYVDASETPVSA